MRKLTYWLTGLALICIGIGAVLLLNNIREITWQAAQNSVCEATLADAAGVDISSAFRFSFEDDVSANAVRRFLSVEPAIEMNFHQGLQAKEVLAVPVEPLQPGVLYHFSLATEAQTLQWAFQTKREWRALRASPALASTGVDPHSSIEVYFNQSLTADAAALAEHWQMTPATVGSFEQDGPCLRFRPEQPLAPRTVYAITLSSGLSAQGSDMLLAEDFSFAFETANADGSTPQLLWQAAALNTCFQPGQLPAFSCDFFGDTPAPTADTDEEGWPLGQPLQTVLYRYTDAAAFAAELLAEQRRVPLWSYQGRYAVQADTASLTRLNTEEFYPQATEQGYRFSWPNTLPPGCYLLQTSYLGQSSYIRFQVSSLAVFVQSTIRGSLFWARKAPGGQPAASCQITHVNSGVSGLTDASGLLRMALPHELTPLNGAGDMLAKQDVYLLSLGQEQLVLGDFGLLNAWELDLGADIWQYAVLDKETYNSGDSLQFWGYLRRRDNADWEWGRVSLYICAAGQPGQPIWQGYAPLSKNIFHGSLELPRLLPGLYELQVWQSGQLLITQPFNVDSTPIYMSRQAPEGLRLTSDKAAYSPQESYTLRLEGAVEDQGPYLFFKSGGGLREVIMESTAQHQDVFSPEDVGGAYWQAVAFAGGRYQISPFCSLGTESLSHSLRLQAQTETTPGGETVIQISVRDVAGNVPAQGSVLALIEAPGRVLEDMAAELYAPNRRSGLTGSPYLAEDSRWPATVHPADDTLHFEALTLDKNGEAELKLPSGLPPGAWRLSAWAVADGPLPLAGSATFTLTEAQPSLAVAALREYRAGDMPQLALSWQGLPASAFNLPISYRIDIKGPQGSSQQEVTGNGNADYFTLPALEAGSYELIATAQLAGVTYRAGHDFTVARATFSRYQAAVYAAGEQNGAPHTGWLYIGGQGRVHALGLLWQVLDKPPVSGEQRLAAAQARQLWQNYGTPNLSLPELEVFPDLSAFQQANGGMAAWPGESAELYLSLLTASLTSENPAICDQAALARYFEQWSLGQATVEERAMALAGLAALGRPVLPELKLLLSQTADAYSRACLIWGLVQSGDVQVARSAFSELLAAHVSDATSGNLYLEGGQGDNIRLNCVGAMLAAATGAEQTVYALLQYLENQQATDALTVALVAEGLLKRCYAPAATVALTLNGRRQQVELAAGAGLWLELELPGEAALADDTQGFGLVCLSLKQEEMPDSAALAAGFSLKREMRLLFNENNDAYLSTRVDYQLEAKLSAGEYTLCEYLPALNAAEQVQLLSGQRYLLTGQALYISVQKQEDQPLQGYLEYILPLSEQGSGWQAVAPPSVLRAPGGRLSVDGVTEVLAIEE